jgi:hypothetical protein
MAGGIAANLKIKTIRIAQSFGGTATVPDLGVAYGSGAEIDYSLLHADDKAKTIRPSWQKPADALAATVIAETPVYTLTEDAIIIGLTFANAGVQITTNDANYVAWWARAIYPDGSKKSVAWGSTRATSSGGFGTIAATTGIADFFPSSVVVGSSVTFGKPRVLLKGTVLTIQQLKYGTGQIAGAGEFLFTFMPLGIQFTASGDLLGGSILSGVKWAGSTTKSYEIFYQPGANIAAISILNSVAAGNNPLQEAAVVRMSTEWGSASRGFPTAAQSFQPPQDMLPECLIMTTGAKFDKEMMGACPRFYFKSTTILSAGNVCELTITEYLQ